MNRNLRNRASRLWLSGAALGLVCIGGVAARADDGATPTPVVDPKYRLGIDDIISITSPGHEDITQDTTVLPDGFIHVSGLTDPIFAEGLTIAQVKAKIFKGLDRLYNNLELSVKIREATSQSVIILGSRTPGRFPLRQHMRISTLMALSGRPSR